jgi:dihydrofolate synthase/folylpolyglutamate synthase
MSAPAITSYREALAWLYSFTDTERSGFVRDREDNLARMRALLAPLGNPQRAYGVTHIAGTKGKGSTAALLAAILEAAGVRTGLYTSPDLHTFRERMRMDGQLISEEMVVRLMPQLQAAVATLDPALGPLFLFEPATALAFLYFREAGAQHAVVEVGLGGRLDATNVVEPLATAITSISYDHMHILGHTLGEIAGEKAGIIKPGVPVVTSAQAPEAFAVIERIAGERGAPLVRVGPATTQGSDYTYTPGAATSEGQSFTIRTPTGEYCDLEVGLLGEHQLENATAAVALAETLRAAGLGIPEDAIRRGLREARWPGRMQVVAREPWVVVDSAHNADSFAHLFTALRRHFAFDRLILVLGLLADKDLPGIASEIARAGVDAVIATTSPSPRAQSPGRIAEAIQANLSPGHSPARGGEIVDLVPDIAAALDRALQIASPRDLVCVAGSVYLAGAALRCLAARPEVTPGTIEVPSVDH